MSWNYRVVLGQEDSYTIHEIYYNEDMSIKAWIESPASPYGASASKKI